MRKFFFSNILESFIILRPAKPHLVTKTASVIARVLRRFVISMVTLHSLFILGRIFVTILFKASRQTAHDRGKNFCTLVNMECECYFITVVPTSLC